MAGTSWLVDSRRIATKIKSASSAGDPNRVKWKSEPTRACPNCNHIIDNSDVSHEWPGLPRGVKFDPSDQEIIWHLLSKVGHGNVKPHPFIDEFIPTVQEDDGICYAHPQNLPGVKQDGSVAHFFHRAIKAYNTGTRKRRKIHGDDQGDVRWHKTGRTKPVVLDGIQKGCKKIMVLYLSTGKGGKPEKTNWVMHQYHLGTGEDEKDGEFIVSKVFYQQQAKPGDKVEQELPLEIMEPIIAKVDPVTPKSVIPEPRLTGKHHSDVDLVQEPVPTLVDISDQTEDLEDGMLAEWVMQNDQVNQRGEDNDNQLGEDFKLFEGESQLVFDSQQLLDSQQLAEQISLCKEFFSSQSSNVEGNGDEDGYGDGDKRKMKPCLSDYSCMGADALKKDLEECRKLGGTVPQNNGKGKIVEQDLDSQYLSKKDSDSQSLATFDPSNIELDTPPDVRLSQLEFGSQDSFIRKLLSE